MTGLAFGVSCTNMKSRTAPTRAYRMRARAEGVAETRTRILDAAVDAFWDALPDEVSLEEVARRAGVSGQTVIRHFSGKQLLFAAAVEHGTKKVERQRAEAPPGDIPATVRVLFDHYEELGDRVLRLLAEEQRMPALSEVVDIGRRSHRAWCERVFAPALARVSGVERKRRLAQFVSICDVYTWKLLRRDARLSRRQAELAMVEMVEPLMEV